jgi:integrase
MQPLIRPNVVMLHNDSVHAHITKFLNRLGSDSENTKVEYKRDIERFFKLMLGKDTNQLSIKDLDIKKIDVEEYQTFLIKQGYKASSINRWIASVKSLYNSFEENGFKYTNEQGEIVYIKAAPLNVDKLDTAKDSESYGMITHEEMKEMIRLANELPNGQEKSLMLELASVTSFRLDALVQLKWSDFRKENDTWVIKTIDKSKTNEKSIRTDLYERLLATKTDNKVFHMTAKTFERTIKTLATQIGIDDDRNITFHSIKKYGIMEVWMATGGDIIKTAEQGNHSSFETTKKYYMMFEKDYSTMPCLLIGQSVDISPLEEMSKEELLKLIKGCDRGLQFTLLNKINK